MDRRWFGVLLVACVVLAGVVLPNVSARRVAGSPIPAAVDGPPTVGLCILAMTDPWRANPEPGFSVGRTIEFPTALFGPCDGKTAVGEVASLDQSAAPPDHVLDNDYQTVVSQCSLDAIGYLGSIPPVVDRGAGPGILWASVLAFRYTSIGPTAVQRAAGQRWTACAVGPTGVTPYQGGLRNVLSTGTLPPVFGSCLRSIDLRSPAEIGCDSPHAVELLGWTTLSSIAVSAPDLRQACTAYSGRALRTADPTRNGAIRPDVVVFDGAAGTIPPDGANIQDGYVACVLIAEHDRHFTNTLVGIGQRPLPLA